MTTPPALRVIEPAGPGSLDDSVLAATAPVLLRGLVAHWPAVQAARESDEACVAQLMAHDCGATVGLWRGAPEIDGRFFYNEALDGFNFESGPAKLAAVFQALAQQRHAARPEALYVGSTTLDTCLPGFRDRHDLPLGDRATLASIWIGNRTRIAAHHDLPDNLACVVAGQRRFTLFPPEALPHLYVGPLDFTPAGQAISLVDFAQPDLQRFPRFAQALAMAQVVELQAGDAIFIPSLWWHHVEALAPLNVLVNHWWRSTPPHMDTPMNALLMACLSVRDLPSVQRQHWRRMFEHYVFEADEHTAAHIPGPARGVLARHDANAARVLRARLLRSLNR